MKFPAGPPHMGMNEKSGRGFFRGLGWLVVLAVPVIGLGGIVLSSVRSHRAPPAPPPLPAPTTVKIPFVTDHQAPLVTDVNGDGVDDVVLFADSHPTGMDRDDDTYLTALDGASLYSKQLWITRPISTHVPHEMARAGRSIVAIDGGRGVSLFWAMNGAARTQFAVRDGARHLWRPHGVDENTVFFDGVDGVAHAIDGNAGAVIDDQAKPTCSDDFSNCQYGIPMRLEDVIGAAASGFKGHSLVGPRNAAWVAGDRFIAFAPNDDALGLPDVVVGGSVKSGKIAWMKELTDSAGKRVRRPRVWGVDPDAGAFYVVYDAAAPARTIAAHAIEDAAPLWRTTAPRDVVLAASHRRVFTLSAADDSPHPNSGNEMTAVLRVYDTTGAVIAESTHAELRAAFGDPL
jgi:hypothetical protein